MTKLSEYISQIEKTDLTYKEKALERQDNLTKPQGSLGLLETLSAEVSAIMREEKPVINRKVIFTLAGDHGITEEGVSAFPKEVTLQMVYNFLNGGAAINVLGKNAGAEVIVGDFGAASDIDTDNPNFKNRKIGYGTKNFVKGSAMTADEAVKSVLNGIELFEEENKRKKIDLCAAGEMGIGNTTPATAILSAVSGMAPEEVTGRGTGVDDEGLNRKISAIKKGIELNRPDKDSGIDILSKVGGFEIGGMAGIMLAAAKNRIPVIIDGFISTAAALIAYKLNPLSAQYMIASHSSVEHGHIKMLDILGKKPVFDLGFRLGEGTGAALAMNFVEASAKILSEMATFTEAGVSKKE